MTADDDLAHNRTTVSGYDVCAESYASGTDNDPTPDHLEALETFASAAGVWLTVVAHRAA